MNEKPCFSVPCPQWEDVELTVTAVCDCLGRLLPGQEYAPGCPVHDPEVVAES